MAAKFIVNQDRDQIHEVMPKTTLFTEPVLVDGECAGFKLMLNVQLGQFDTLEEANEHANNIATTQQDIYALPLYSSKLQTRLYD